MRYIIVPALAALSLSVLASPTTAETRTVSVPYGDLDISSSPGLATLEGRIRKAIRTVCGRADPLNLASRRAQRRCMRDTQVFVGIELARVTGKPPVLTLNQRRNRH